MSRYAKGAKVAEERFASGVHGCSAVINQVGPAQLDFRGNGVTVSVGQRRLIHLQVPTPAVVRNKRATLERVHYLFKAEGGAQLQAVDVFDGLKQLLHVDGLTIEGDHSRDIDDDNSHRFPRPLPQVFWGVGISLLVRPPGSFFIAAAGAEFLVEA